MVSLCFEEKIYLFWGFSQLRAIFFQFNPPSALHVTLTGAAPGGFCRGLGGKGRFAG
jgi:hypothetical protein